MLDIFFIIKLFFDNFDIILGISKLSSDSSSFGVLSDPFSIGEPSRSISVLMFFTFSFYNIIKFDCLVVDLELESEGSELEGSESES